MVLLKALTLPDLTPAVLTFFAGQRILTGQFGSRYAHAETASENFFRRAHTLQKVDGIYIRPENVIHVMMMMMMMIHKPFWRCSPSFESAIFGTS